MKSWYNYMGDQTVTKSLKIPYGICPLAILFCVEYLKYNIQPVKQFAVR